MAALGIDFGSSYTTMSWINPRHGKPEAIKFNGDGSVKFPSVILGTESGLELGYSALSYLEEVNKLSSEESLEILSNFIPSIKRVLDPNGIEFLGGKKYTHFELLTQYFKFLKQLANEHCGNEIDFNEVTISHPVEFEISKINLLKQSLLNAGFNTVKTTMEPVSAAFGYSIDHIINENERLLIFDFGGGTIDVAFVKKHNGSLNLLCQPKGNSMCGGQDFDLLLYEDLRKRILCEYNKDISYNGLLNYGMLNSCRRLKEHFSGQNDSYDTSVIFVNNNRIITYKYKLSREAFNNIIYQKAIEAINVAKEVIEQVKQKGIPISKVLLIGGSSQLSIIRSMLHDILPDSILDTCGEKDVAVALGNIYVETEKTKIVDDNSQKENSKSKKVNDEVKLNYDRSITCKNPNCHSKRCSKLIEPPGYHCVDCGGEGKNVVVVY